MERGAGRFGGREDRPVPRTACGHCAIAIRGPSHRDAGDARTRLAYHADRGEPMSSTVLVTGSSGFVGRAIMARLPAGQRAIGLDPVARRRTQVIDDLSDRARLRDLIARESDHPHHPCGRRVRPDGAGGRSGRRDGDQRHRQHEPAVRGDGRRRRRPSSIAPRSRRSGISTSRSRSARTIRCGRARPMAAPRPRWTIVLRGLWGKVPLDICSLRLTAVYGPGRQTEFNVDTIVRAALAGQAGAARSADRLAVRLCRRCRRCRDRGLLLATRAGSLPISSRIPSA